jgi:hypothetical protein
MTVWLPPHQKEPVNNILYLTFGTQYNIYLTIRSHFLGPVYDNEKENWRILTHSVRAQYIHCAASHASRPNRVLILRNFHKAVK